MTEAEWLTASDPEPMLGFLRGRVSDRKLRLFAIACCRSIPGFLDSSPDRESLELSEIDVDARVDEDAFDHFTEENWDIRWYRRDGWDAAYRAIESFLTESEFVTEGSPNDLVFLANLLREVVHYPPRRLTLERSWLTKAVIDIAQAIYDERQLPSGLFDNQRMGVLADALEEAGCDNADILNHCRQPGEHVRGCWVVDLVVGKE